MSTMVSQTADCRTVAERQSTALLHTTESEAESRAERDEILARSDMQDKTAQSAQCAYRSLGCDGDWHEGGIRPDQWCHRVALERFDLVEVEIGIEPGQSEFRAYGVTAWASDWSSSEMVEHAAVWGEYPAFIRRIAARLDELNGVLK